MAFANSITPGTPLEGYAPSTSERRGRMVAAWERWCATGSIPPFPASPALLARWCRSRVGRVGVTTMRAEIVALRRHHEERGMPFPEPAALRRMLRELDELGRVTARPDLSALREAATAIVGDEPVDVRDRALLFVIADGLADFDDVLLLTTADLVVTEAAVVRGGGTGPVWLQAAQRVAVGVTAQAVRRWLEIRPSDAPTFFTRCDGGGPLLAADLLVILRLRSHPIGADFSAPDVPLPARAVTRVRTLAEVV